MSTGANGRTIEELATGWSFVKGADGLDDASDLEGASGLEAALAAEREPVQLPHTWNAQDGADGGDDYWRGTAWYVRELALSRADLAAGERAWLEFAGAAMTADVYVNGAHLAHHEGGYSTFRVDITDALAATGASVLAVSVDNSQNDRVYPQTADFTFYGGLYRQVRLIRVPREHFALDYHGASGLRVTPQVNLEDGSAEVTLEAWVEGAAADGAEVQFAISGQAGMGGQGTLTVSAPVVDGRATAQVQLAHAHLWDGLADPFLYTATACLSSGDEVSARFGCRVFEVDADRGFLLNGRPYPLRGVSRHQDREGVGCAITPAMHREDLDIIQEMGANSVRLAHYQHAQEFYDLCDERGIVVWAEVPAISMRLASGDDNARSQLRELIVQNSNHACIACWCLSNEFTSASPVDDALVGLMSSMNDLAHRLDPTRPTSMAHVFMLDTQSPLLNVADLNTYNLYYGWYVGELEQNEEFLDEFHAEHPGMSLGLTEYGADANPRFQSASPASGDYSEQYQCRYHEHLLNVIEERPWLWASYVWNMFDFAADGRNAGGRDGQNQKGLVTFDRRTRKDAFYLYKAHWSEEPFVHVCGSRYVDRAEDQTEVTVYSNQPQVDLLVDGTLFASATGRCVFRFAVPLAGEHVIEARAGECADSIKVRHVAEPNPDYVLPAAQPVSNWFANELLDPGCYSTHDTVGALMANPRTAAVVGPLMEESAKRYGGDVATSAMDNPMIQRIMQRSALEDLLKQAGAADADTLRALNDALQKVRKPAEAAAGAGGADAAGGAAEGEA